MRTSKAAAPHSEARTIDMAARWSDGETLDSIGLSYGLTRERVRQIIQASGLTTAAEARAARRRRHVAELDELRGRARAWLVDHPASDCHAVAAALDVSPARLREAMGDESKVRFVVSRGLPPVVSDADIIEALRDASTTHGNPLAADRYDEFSHAHGVISSVRIIQRFGTWNAACAAAGLRTNSGRASYSRRWTEAQMLEHVADYLMSPGAPGTYAGYDQYARLTSAAPSAQTVRNAFGGWSNMKAGALQIVAARERRQRVA